MVWKHACRKQLQFSPCKPMCWPLRARPVIIRSLANQQPAEGFAMTAAIDRRHFLSATAAAGVAVGLGASAEAAGQQAAGANNRLVVGIMGTGGRGTGLAATFQ